MIWSNEDMYLLNKLEVVIVDIFAHKAINIMEPTKQKKKEFRGTNRYMNYNYKARRHNESK